MKGMNHKSGKVLSGVAHLRQSLQDILTTPIGTRVMRREYGSDVFKFVDAPLNRSTVISIIAATAVAIEKWEPRLKLERVQIEKLNDQGQTQLMLEGEYLPDGKRVTLDGT